MSQRTVAVVGGAVAGLAAADRLATRTDVTLFERQSYDHKRVNCGEAINDATLVPLEKTPENGFLNDVDGFELRVFRRPDRAPDADPIGVSRLRCAPGYITDRDVVERRWASKLERDGVEVRENESVGPDRLRALCREYDYVIDATGQPALSVRTFGDLDAYTGDTVAVNADVTGEFAETVSRPQIFFEGYLGYAWLFPKTETRANVGIGWAGEERPDDYFGAFEAACHRNEIPLPDREAVNIYTIPRGPSLDPAATYRADENVLLVGDAAGIANRYQGEGICQAIRSAYLAAETIREGRPGSYPERLYAMMRSEYRLAHLMRGIWVEHEDTELLAAVAEAIDGLTIDDITRTPARVAARLARHPLLVARVLADRGMLRRVVDAYTDTWEYDRR
ncbi:MAG: NAD(P)/FAD-dependent oxidoreductase [Haloquadratum sp.]